MSRILSRLSITLCLILFLSISGNKLYAQIGSSSIIITEVLASNGDVLLDDDGNSSDWIELYNQSDETISLENWYLTDNSNDLLKWQFPKTSMVPGEFLVIFASGKDVKDPNKELHTNFKLNSEGEYLALIENDGQTIASQFNPTYNAQLQDISYGLVQNTTSSILVGPDTSGKLLVPTNDNLNLTWTGQPLFEPFSETNWTTVTSPIGFDKREVTVGNQNLVHLATASQSSDWAGFPASFVNDKIYNNFTHTADGDLSPWLDLNFDTEQTIGEIVLYNRTNCCPDRLYNITIEISNSQGDIIFTSEQLNPYEEGETPVSPGNSISLNLLDYVPQGVTGTKIRISKTPVSSVKEYISLAEVEVFGIDQNYSNNISSHIETEMFDINSTAYLRFPFNINDEKEFNALLLKMTYDDGFIAYVNGTRVASKNAPTITPDYNDNANELHLAENIELFTIPTNVLKQGENILAIQGFNLALNDLSFFIKPQLEGLKITTINKEVYFENPTPGTYNEGGLDGITGANHLNFERGFYDTPFELTISNSTPGVAIIYTTDGSDPSELNGTKISAPSPTTLASTKISITKTIVVRSIATKENYKPTNIDTNTYIFVEDVIASDVMDKSITQHATYGPQMKNALTDLPTLSIAIHPGTINKFDDEFASIEWILPNGDPGFQENTGIRYFGGEWAGPFNKQNFRLYFRKKYGASKLEFPLFEGHENSVDPVSIFDQLEIRAGSHDMVQRGFYMSNRFTDDTMLDMGNLNPHGRFIHVYLNGVYWGQYHLRERWNADMIANYLGGKKKDYEAINGNKNIGGWAVPGNPYDGDGSAWTRVKSLRDNYNQITPYLDVAHYIDFMLMFMYGNSEAEYKTVGPTSEGSGFKFFLNDADGYLRDTGNRTSMRQPGQRSGDGPGSIFSMLFKEASPKYKILLADRIHKHFFNNGAMTPEKIEARLLDRCDQVERSFYAESARWGYRTPESWDTAKNDYLDNVVPFRTSTVIEQFRNAGFYPSIEAPSLSINDTEHYGGKINEGDLLSLTAASGDIYYTLDGSDPYLPGDNNAEFITLVEENAQKTILVPENTLLPGWNSDVNFDDSGWTNGTGSFGYERGNEVGKEIGIDIENTMYNRQTGCLARIKFDINNLSEIKRLFLYLSYDDGAIVYLNGKEIVKVNAPSGTPLYNAIALSGIEANPLASFNITEHLNHLKTGTNILAIHGMNISLTSSDFYIDTKLVADIGEIAENMLSPSAIKYDGDVEINETTIVKSRAMLNGEWSALSDAEYIIEVEEELVYLDVNSYPNPFTDDINISFRVEDKVTANLAIYDALGRVIWDKEFTIEADELSATNISTSFWDNGLYIYQLKLSSGELFSDKLICNKNGL